MLIINNNNNIFIKGTHSGSFGVDFWSLVTRGNSVCVFQLEKPKPNKIKQNKSTTTIKLRTFVKRIKAILWVSEEKSAKWKSIENFIC